MTRPLESWNDSPARATIIEFVERVTDTSGPDFVPPADRIATFDNDGTLWCEYPLLVQAYFLIDRVKTLIAHDPSWADKPVVKAVREKDHKALAAMGKRAILQTIAEIHGGMSEDDFTELAGKWLSDSVHPTLGTRFADNVYRPQVELLEYLRANQFRTFIVTGGGIEFVREISEEKYGIMRENVVGSNNHLTFRMDDDGAHVIKLPELNSFDDREEKPVNIALHIGRRPIFVFGNSDGDLAMCRYALAGDGPRLAMLIHHDDAEREFAYDRDFKLSPFADALDNADSYGVKLVSMKNDWALVF